MNVLSFVLQYFFGVFLALVLTIVALIPASNVFKGEFKRELNLSIYSSIPLFFFVFGLVVWGSYLNRPITDLFLEFAILTFFLFGAFVPLMISGNVKDLAADTPEMKLKKQKMRKRARIWALTWMLFLWALSLVLLIW